MSKYQLYDHDLVQERYVVFTKEELGDELWENLFKQLGETGSSCYTYVELRIKSGIFQNTEAEVENLVRNIK